MDPTPLREYIDEVGDLPEDILLGKIVLFTINETPVEWDHLDQSFTAHQLNKAFLPSQNKYVDAFRKATSETKETYQLSNARSAHLLCRDVVTTNDFIRRQITREIRDARARRLNYDPAIVCTFYRPTDPKDQDTCRLTIEVQTQYLESEELVQVQAIARQIHTRFYDNFQYLDGQKIRAMVRAYLKHLNAIEIKGGVYFVPVSRSAELGRLADVITEIGGGCHMNLIPIVDLQRERAFISHVFEREASQSLSEVAKEARELLANRKSISPAAYNKLKARYDEILNNAEEHSLNLQLTQDITAASAEVALSALLDLGSAMLDV